MAKGDKFYFENFAACAALSQSAANYLVECLENYDPEKLEECLKRCTKSSTRPTLRSMN